MDKKSELDCYMFYLWNKWNKSECIAIFGERLGKHVWNKWGDLCVYHGATGAPAALYAALDSELRRKIVEHAVAHYNK